jgi:hypothetical protein
MQAAGNAGTRGQAAPLRRAAAWGRGRGRSRARTALNDSTVAATSDARREIERDADATRGGQVTVGAFGAEPGLTRNLRWRRVAGVAARGPRALDRRLLAMRREGAALVA